MPRKIAIITINLVKESVETDNNKIEEEILEFLAKSRIPWMEEVEKVTVLGSRDE